MAKKTHKEDKWETFELSEKQRENPLLKEGIDILKKRRKLMERLSKV